MSAFASVLVICFAFLASCEPANILGVFTSTSPSHLIIHMSYAKAMAERGHNVTVVTTIPLGDKNTHYHHILLKPSEARLKEMDKMKAYLAGSNTTSHSLLSVLRPVQAFVPLQYEAFKDQKFLDFMHNPDNKFDLIIVGYFFTDYMIGLAEHFNCPIVLSWMGMSNILVNTYIGNPLELAYVPVFITDGTSDPLKFTNRLKAFLTMPVAMAFKFIVDWQMTSYYNDFFPSPKYSSLKEVSKKVSLVLCNSHFSEGIIRPNVPALIDVGGIQIKEKPDPLPKDLKEIMDASSEHGVLLVSFGSNIESSGLHPQALQSIYEVLASLKQNVIWKYAGQNKPGDAPNIHYASWLPQDDLLAHPNLRLFITHAGKGSVAESEYHGVPMIAIPIFGDQPGNAKQLASTGFGLYIDYADLTVQTLNAAIFEVLGNTIYADNVKRFSKLYRDRPMTAKQTAVYWLEYVIRHKGAYHMQSPLVHLNSLQYMCLDVVAFLLLVALISLKLISIPIKFVMRKICGAMCSKPKKQKKT